MAMTDLKQSEELEYWIKEITRHEKDFAEKIKHEMDELLEYSLLCNHLKRKDQS